MPQCELNSNLGLEIVAIHPVSGNLAQEFRLPFREPRMQSLHVNGYDMPYLDVGEDRGRPPLVCVHGSLNDFRVWGCVLGPLSQRHRLICVSLRHFFPARWDGVGDTYSIAQHVDDVIAFIEELDLGSVDLMGHSRGGHICFRVAQRRPGLLRRLVLAGPRGGVRASLGPRYAGGSSPPVARGTAPGRRVAARRRRCGPARLRARFTAWAERIAAGAVDGGLAVFVDTLEGAGTWPRLRALVKQNLRDNAFTLIGQVRDNRPPFSKADAESITMPTLFILGARTKGLLPKVLHALAAHVPYSRTAVIPNATHPMFEQAPKKSSEVVLVFRAG